MCLVNGTEDWLEDLETDEKWKKSQSYGNGVIHQETTGKRSAKYGRWMMGIQSVGLRVIKKSTAPWKALSHATNGPGVRSRNRIPVRFRWPGLQYDRLANKGWMKNAWIPRMGLVRFLCLSCVSRGGVYVSAKISTRQPAELLSLRLSSSARQKTEHVFQLSDVRLVVLFFAFARTLLARTFFIVANTPPFTLYINIFQPFLMKTTIPFKICIIFFFVFLILIFFQY